VTPVTTETETETEHASSFADEARNLSRPDRCRKHQAAAADTPCKPCAFAHKAWANSPTKKLIQLCPDCDALGGTLDSANSFESELCLHPRIGVA
jgi:hypothetical protein